MTDVYALYLTSYLAAMNNSGTFPIPDTGGTRELQAIALGIEDAMAYKAACEGRDGPRREDENGEVTIVGRRERWDVLCNIDEHEAPEKPDE